MGGVAQSRPKLSFRFKGSYTLEPHIRPGPENET